MSENKSKTAAQKNPQEWNYTDKGPSYWIEKYPVGNHQSPINIETKNAIYDSNLASNPLKLNFDKECFTKIENTGNSFQVSGSDKAISRIYGGPITVSGYKFLQFHAHWGPHIFIGSEHLVDGKSFAGELHFVNWNSTRYSSPSDAVKSNNHDGLAVLGVFVQIGKKNSEIDKIIKSINTIKTRGNMTDLMVDFDIFKLFPNDLTKYWTYQGSLTTPPLTESVQWIVFSDPIEISLDQQKKLSELYQCSDAQEICASHKITSNFRPICELNNRVVSKSFDQSLGFAYCSII